MTKFIDIHGHCVQEHFVPYLSGPCKGWHQISDPKEMLEFYDRHGVEKGVILPLCNAENAMQSQSNEEVLNIVKMHPDRFIPFCNVDPRNLRNTCTSDYLGVLKWYRDRGCKGLGEMCCNLHFCDARVQALFSAAEEVGFPVTFHMAPFADNNYGLVDEDTFPELEASLKRFPKLRFFGHSQAFWSMIGPNADPNARFGYPSGKITEDGLVVKLMRKYPNLCGDLSAFSGLNALKRFPKLRFFGHSQAFWSMIGTNADGNGRFGYPADRIKGDGLVVNLMRKYPNLCGDLSAGSGLNALKRDRAYAAKFLTEFQDRLLFGMDICSPEGERKNPNGLAAFLSDLLAKGEISQTVFNKVARENAIRILGL